MVESARQQIQSLFPWTREGPFDWAGRPRPGRFATATALLLAATGCQGFRARQQDPTRGPFAREEWALKKGCEDGIGRACNDLGVLYWEQHQQGRATEMTPDPSLSLRRGCELEDSTACSNERLVSALEDMWRKRGARAGARLEQECAQGNAQACFAAGALHANLPTGWALTAYTEYGLLPDLARARGLLERGCGLKSPDACLGLAVLEPAGQQSGVRLQKACADGSLPACNDVAVHQSRGQKPKWGAIADLWLRACKLGQVSAGCISLAHHGWEHPETQATFAKNPEFGRLLLSAALRGNPAARDAQFSGETNTFSPPEQMQAQLSARCTPTDRSGCPDLRLHELLQTCHEGNSWGCAAFVGLPSSLQRVKSR